MFGFRRSSNWLKADVLKSLNHARSRGTREFAISTENATPKNRQNILKWVQESGGLGQILPDGRVGIRIVR